MTFRFRNFSIFLVVSDSISKNFGIEKSIGFSIVKIWYQKKYRIQYCQNLVSDSVSKKFGIRKSFGLSFVQILSILGDVLVSKLLCFGTFSLF